MFELITRYEGGDAKTGVCGGAPDGDFRNCDGNGGLRGRHGSTSFHGGGAGGAGYLQEGESGK